MRSEETLSAELKANRSFLRETAQQVSSDPQTNSVFALASSFFADLESGETEISNLEKLIDEVHLRLSLQRAGRFRAQHFCEGEADPWHQVKAKLQAIAKNGWEAFRSAVETPLGGIVFTAHPTFARSMDMRQCFADYAVGQNSATLDELRTALETDSATWSESISLRGEHAEAQKVLRNAKAAMSGYAHCVLSIAHQNFPDQWRELRLALPTLASWVGYDLDGRTDINWWQSVALRLREKADQLRYYAEQIKMLGEGLGALQILEKRLILAAQLADREAALFDEDLDVADHLLAAARSLSEDHADRITRISEIQSVLEEVVSDPKIDDQLAQKILALHAEMGALKLGTARIHLRVNAAQVRAVISRDLNIETEDRDIGRIALQKLSDMADAGQTSKVNFAELFLEKSTAHRQIMMCSIWLSYIDAESPIRFLIAEAENPATVMGALYLARKHGISENLDISPLFETAEALESGGRFISRLLKEKAFLEYLRSRGYLSIQLGFSDAGRFIGQVAANIAIERIHNLVIRALSDSTENIGLLIFNTHGESMGRGAWPGTFQDRFEHALTPWTRSQAAQRNVPLQHEVSFQGGDGFLHFANPALAQATYAEWCCYHVGSEPRDDDDPYYAEADFVWDTYRSIRTWHERTFENEDYARLLSDFAPNFLLRAGSRQRRRAGGPKGPRSLRAISHNATLQQLGAPLNTAGGIGSAIRRETERLIALINGSRRMRQLVLLAVQARLLTSLPALRAYARIYDPAYWVAISKHFSTGADIRYRRIYYALEDAELSQSINRIANRFAVDLGRFDHLLSSLDDTPSIEERHENRLDIHVLHALRQALMMRALSISGGLPRLSGRHDFSHHDFIALVLEMRLEEAAAQLERVFPKSSEVFSKLSELTDESLDHLSNGYDNVHSDIIEPLRAIHKAMRKTTLAIAEAYYAYG